MTFCKQKQDEEGNATFSTGVLEERLQLYISPAKRDAYRVEVRQSKILQQ